MANHNEEYNKLISKFVNWTTQCDDIRAAVIVGSRARVNEPADEWADLDITIFSTIPEKYLDSTDWLNNMGNYWITFIEDDALGLTKERRVLYEGGLDVDFVFYPDNVIDHLFKNPEVNRIIARGIRVLIDKDNKFGQLNELRSSEKTKFVISEDDLLNSINEFWFHAVRAAKKVLRGELWIAKSTIDSYMKNSMLNLVEIHAKVNNGMDYDTWHNGRFLEKWADQRIIEGLKNSFSYYDKKDIERALIETMNLYRWIAKETCKDLNISYPNIADEKATEWIRINLK